MKQSLAIFLLFNLLINNITAQDIRNNPGSNHGNRFEQLGTILPTPNEYRTASGALAQNIGSKGVITKLFVKLMNLTEFSMEKKRLLFITIS